jgi:hypothetical protein
MFYTLYDFMVYTKCLTYMMMGVTLLTMLGFYLFLTKRDKRSGRPDNWKELHH